METFGRERRHRYYTVAAFRALAAREGLDDSATGYAGIDISAAGDFASYEPELFYNDKYALAIYADRFKDKSKSTVDRNLKNPILADGSVKLGRPRKTPAKVSKSGVTKSLTVDGSKIGRKRKRQADNEDHIDEEGKNQTPTETLSKSKRGRTPKKPRLQATGITDTSNASQSTLLEDSTVDEANIVETLLPKKRGRPPKMKSSQVEEVKGNVDDAIVGSEVWGGRSAIKHTVSKKRGRQLQDTQTEGRLSTAPPGPATTEDNGAPPILETTPGPPKKRSRLSLKNQPPPMAINAVTLAPSSVSQAEAAKSPERSDLLTVQRGVNEPSQVTPANHFHTQPEEPRRSPRKKMPTIRDDATPPKPKRKPAVPKASKVTESFTELTEVNDQVAQTVQIRQSDTESTRNDGAEALQHTRAAVFESRPIVSTRNSQTSTDAITKLIPQAILF